MHTAEHVGRVVLLLKQLPLDLRDSLCDCITAMGVTKPSLRYLKVTCAAIFHRGTTWIASLKVSCSSSGKLSSRRDTMKSTSIACNAPLRRRVRKSRNTWSVWRTTSSRTKTLHSSTSLFGGLRKSATAIIPSDQLPVLGSLACE